VLILPLVDQH